MAIIVVLAIVTLVMNLVLWIRRPHDGEIVITTDRSGKKLFSLELGKTPKEIEKMKRVSFKVVSMHSDNEVLQLKTDYVAE
jgi:hypothetical protein